MGTSFKVTSPGMSLEGWWWWVASDMGTDPEDFALWQVTGIGAGTYVTGSKVTSGTFVAGWNWVACNTPIALTEGQEYRAVKSTNKALTSATNYSATSLYWDTGAGSAGIVNGPLIAFAKNGATTNPEPSGDGQMTFVSGVFDVTADYPNIEFNQTNYWFDVQVTDGGGSPAFSGSPTLSVALAGSAAGYKAAAGSPVLSLGLSGSATGTKKASGSPALSLAFSLVAQGIKRVSGAVSAVLAFAGSVTTPGSGQLCQRIDSGDMTPVLIQPALISTRNHVGTPPAWVPCWQVSDDPFNEGHYLLQGWLNITPYFDPGAPD